MDATEIMPVAARTGKFLQKQLRDEYPFLKTAALNRIVEETVTKITEHVQAQYALPKILGKLDADAF